MRTLLFLIISLIIFFNSSIHAKEKITLSLNEAIILSVRDNSNVQITQLNYISQKFNLFVNEWEFYPHFSLEASASLSRTGKSGQPITTSHNYDVKPGAKLLTPIGTKFEINSVNPKKVSYNPGLTAQITQPLMRGFGTAVVEAALHNAMDSEVIAQLNIQDTLQTTVTDVINAYLDIVFAQQTILIDTKAVQRAEKSVQQTKLFIKAGHKAGNELVTVEADVASAKANLENDKNNLVQREYALLAAIGIDPNMPVSFSDLNIDALIKKYRLPTLADAKKLILENNIQYQIAQITLDGPTARNLLVAEDNTRWQLNLTAEALTGHGAGGGRSAGVNSVFNRENHGEGVGLTLQIPIDDQLAKQAVLNAKIALKQARITLKKQKWDIETNAINGWNSVVSAERALHFAENAERLQAKTYDISYQKYTHGLIDSLDLQTAQVQLIQAQQNLLSNQIGYLKALVSLDLLIGHTLTTWDVKVRMQ